MTDHIGNGKGHIGLDAHGIHPQRDVFWTLSVSALYEQVAQRHEGMIVHNGPLAVKTGVHTGRSPNDKYIVREPSSEAHVNWGKTNKPYDAQYFDVMHRMVADHLAQRDVFVQDVYGGADENHRLSVRIITELAWQSVFARNVFIRLLHNQFSTFEPQFTVLAAPSFVADPVRDGLRSGTFIIIDFAKRLVLIGGTSYAGEIKKAVFTVLNYLLPLQGVLPMHCSANIGENGDVALFFGLSGTGKTTLSADSTRGLIGDDEHGWSANGIFNFEGGCYAKVIDLSLSREPEIYAAVNHYGTVLENVVVNNHTRRVDYNDGSLTENTRAAYPLRFVPNAITSGTGPHPRNVVMLTADAFGVLPPISKLSHNQAAYHFLSGYTAKVAGTEKGIVEPEATFSTCFGAPFMVHHPTEYANMLIGNIARHDVNCWLVNTGWSGGPYGIGSRIRLSYTREMVRSVLEDQLNGTPLHEDPIFKLHIPEHIPGVPSELLQPRNTWADKTAYDAQAALLARQFDENFKQFGKPELAAT